MYQLGGLNHLPHEARNNHHVANSRTANENRAQKGAQTWSFHGLAINGQKIFDGEPGPSVQCQA